MRIMFQSAHVTGKSPGFSHCPSAGSSLKRSFQVSVKQSAAARCKRWSTTPAPCGTKSSCVNAWQSAGFVRGNPQSDTNRKDNK